MLQDQFFFEGEGDCWFRRNKDKLNENKIDWPAYMIKLLVGDHKIESVLELGCANGYRLNMLRQYLEENCFLAGIDASLQAIRDGKNRYPDLCLKHGLLTKVPLNQQFDLVIVNFVLHWVDRATLSRSIAEIDRLLKNGGILILGDFLPDFPQRRYYHHCPDEKIYTYKQDYAKIFEALGIYKEIARFTFNHDCPELRVSVCGSSARGFCAALHKSLHGYYPEL